MKDCIFCKIINNEISSNTIYEDDLVKVFLDANPSTNGHMLIVPKKHYENILDVDQEIYNHSIKLIKEKLYSLVKEKLNCCGVTISQNNEYGQEVKHLHIHVIPRYENDLNVYSYNKEILMPIEEVYSKLKSE